jgi:hypothetical protein
MDALHCRCQQVAEYCHVDGNQVRQKESTIEPFRAATLPTYHVSEEDGNGERTREVGGGKSNEK